ncbi:hypothetical protein VitviT2T_025302 [Vitis vinifera]|uniref:protein-serine/threonine phosphatase n=1 Tax=Vitis vinifera TaxID=29760 RepID=A0ABY9DIM3_VITVI|nr:hypothetical protein VitviT2T_025302 [Vitis vinifera]
MVSKTTSDDRRLSRLNAKRVRNARRRRLEFRRMKPKCQSETDVGVGTGVDEKEEKSNVEDCSTEISLSFSSSSPSSSENDAIPAKKTEVARSFQPPSYGTVSVIGRRREMEDAVRVELGFWSGGGERYDFFGVYDGHGGVRVAEVCRERLHRVLAEEIEKENCGGGGGWERAMKRCFGKVDDEVVSGGWCRKENGAVNTVGSTAVVAVVGGEVVVVANCGDSRAVICRDGVAVPLSNDHKPNRPDELDRVEAAGGRVINWDGYRVLGVLATSRSIGDQHLKPFVISEPEVTVSERTDADEFLILASDGLWDVISNEVACQVVRRCLDGQAGRIRKIENGRSSHAIEAKSRVAEAATLLVEMAMGRGKAIFNCVGA